MMDNTPFPMPKLAGKKILIVEDDPIMREGLGVAIEQEGGRAAFATNGREALSHLHARSLPDLILLDMLLPLMDGWSFLSQFKQLGEWSHVPVVIITGLAIASREWGATLGAIDVVKKPAPMDDFVAAIRRNC
jgi:CheY-like chemotaxis protein